MNQKGNKVSENLNQQAIKTMKSAIKASLLGIEHNSVPEGETKLVSERKYEKRFGYYFERDNPKGLINAIIPEVGFVTALGDAIYESLKVLLKKYEEERLKCKNNQEIPREINKEMQSIYNKISIIQKVYIQIARRDIYRAAFLSGKEPEEIKELLDAFHGKFSEFYSSLQIGNELNNVNRYDGMIKKLFGQSKEAATLNLIKKDYEMHFDENGEPRVYKTQSESDSSSEKESEEQLHSKSSFDYFESIQEEKASVSTTENHTEENVNPSSLIYQNPDKGNFPQVYSDLLDENKGHQSPKSSDNSNEQNSISSVLNLQQKSQRYSQSEFYSSQEGNKKNSISFDIDHSDSNQEYSPQLHSNSVNNQKEQEVPELPDNFKKETTDANLHPLPLNLQQKSQRYSQSEFYSSQEGNKKNSISFDIDHSDSNQEYSPQLHSNSVNNQKEQEVPELPDNFKKETTDANLHPLPLNLQQKSQRDSQINTQNLIDQDWHNSYNIQCVSDTVNNKEEEEVDKSPDDFEKKTPDVNPHPLPLNLQQKSQQNSQNGGSSAVPAAIIFLGIGGSFFVSPLYALLGLVMVLAAHKYSNIKNPNPDKKQNLRFDSKEGFMMKNQDNQGALSTNEVDRDNEGQLVKYFPKTFRNNVFCNDQGMGNTDSQDNLSPKK